MPEYSPEYRPEAAVLPPTHRGGVDDDKGPIHTIPAPNLSPMDKPNFDLATISTSLTSQKAVTSPTPVQHNYEVKTNDVYLNNHPASNIGLIGTNIQLGQPNLPMQTNLHSSLHVGFPGTAGQTPYIINQQIPDLHVGHPAPAGPPLSATQLYDLLNSFPQKMPEQYQTGQQPQLQQHILQQQLGQFFQPTGVTGFSQPQMQSFNYDEQDNKEQQQQQVLFNQDYVAGRVNTNYNVGPETSINDEESAGLQQNEDLTYITDGNEQLENNIEYEENNDQKDQTTYFNKVANDDGISTQFYTTLPNREAAEKLAALAAAGNVNSQLIGQLRKQQQQQENVQSEETMPPNHKNEEYKTNEQINNDRYNQKYYQDRVQNRQKQQYSQQKHEQLQYEERQKEYDRKQNHQQNIYNNKRPLRIMVPDENDYSNTEPQNDEKKENTEIEYEYENDETDIRNSQSFDERSSYDQSNAEFGSRLSPKTGI